MEIRPATVADAVAIAAIYGDEVRSGYATFETVPPEPSGWVEVIEHEQDGHHVLVAVDGGVVGYAKSGTFRPRQAYDTTVETSIYLTRPGQGIGTRLYQALFALLDSGPCHLAVANIALPNAASIRLHKRFGFTEAGTLVEVGRKFGEWHDVVAMQRPLA